MNTAITMMTRCAGIALLMLFALTPALAQNDRAADEAAIRNNIKEMQAAWKSKNGARYAQVFAEDADFVVITGNYVKGRAEIARGHQQIFDTIFKETTITLNVKQIRFLRPDVAVVHVTGRREGPTKELTKGAIVTMVMTKGEDGWKVAAFQNTAAPLQ